MPHSNWCGKPCCDCETSCGLDKSIPCSPDCQNLGENGETNSEACKTCDALNHDRTFTVTEWCSECENEVEMTWDTDVDGYKAYCPHCGKVLMLCDECKHSEDNPSGACDWTEGKDGKGHCFRKKEEE